MRMNWIISVVSIIFAIIVIALASNFESAFFGDDFSGPSFFPTVCATFLIFLSVILFLLSKRDKTIANIDLSAFKVPVTAIVILIIYVALLNYIGFSIDTFLLSITILLLFGIKRPLLVPFFALLLSYLITYIFSNLLLVSLPEGILPSIVQLAIPAICIIYIGVGFIYFRFRKNGEE